MTKCLLDHQKIGFLTNVPKIYTFKNIIPHEKHEDYLLFQLHSKVGRGIVSAGAVRSSYLTQS